MRQKIVAGNWKMHGTKAMALDLVTAILNNSKNLTQQNQIILIPPYVYLEKINSILENSAIALGAQNLSEYSVGAYTGEIAAAMLKDVGCSYVLVGHSERRQLFGESDALIAQKFQLALQAKLIPILCLGETLEQRKNNETINVIRTQLKAILSLENGVELLRNVVLAYEPVWAIGTGQTATPEQAQEVHSTIRHIIAEHNSVVAQNLCILYGGSVKAANASGLFGMADIDGALVGGASLNSEDFMEICQCNL